MSLKMGSEAHSRTNITDPYPPRWDEYAPSAFDTTGSPETDEYVDYIYEFIKEMVYPDAHEWFLIAAYVVIFVTGVIGNFLVCFAVLRNEHMRTVTNYYIVNLALSDILVVLVCLPPNVMVDATETWFFGDLACHIVPYIQEVCLSVSVYTLAAIAVDRYLAICRPLKFHIRASRTLFIVAAIWVTSFAIMAPQPVFTRSEASSHAEYVGKPVWLMKCFEKAWMGSLWQKAYHIGKVVVSYVVPLLIMAVAYARVCRRLWSGIPTDESHRPALGGRSAGQTKPTMNKSTETQLESRRKVARMLIVVVVMFAICKLPTHVLNTIRYMDGFKAMKAPDNTESSGRVALHVSFLIAHFMAYLNNVINPVIYNFLSARFRKEFRHVFSCCPCVTAPDQRKRPGSASYHRCRDFTARSSNNGITSQSDFRSHDHNTEYLQLSKLGKTSSTNNNTNIVINTKPLAPNPE